MTASEPAWAPVIAEEDPDQPDIVAMLAAADAYYAALYPADRNYLLDLGSLRQPDVSFQVARVDGLALGYGAIVRRGDDWAEIKRMYVDPAARGRKVGRLILGALEDQARRLGAGAIRLETGDKQLAALGLYRAAGYRQRGPFGSYAADETSVFLEKRL